MGTVQGTPKEIKTCRCLGQKITGGDMRQITQEPKEKLGEVLLKIKMLKSIHVYCTIKKQHTGPGQMHAQKKLKKP